jgi:hypothetical protein
MTREQLNAWLDGSGPDLLKTPADVADLLRLVADLPDAELAAVHEAVTAKLAEVRALKAARVS